MIPDEVLREQVQESLETLPTSSVGRWESFTNIYSKYCKEVSSPIVILLSVIKTRRNILSKLVKFRKTSSPIPNS